MWTIRELFLPSHRQNNIKYYFNLFNFIAKFYLLFITFIIKLFYFIWIYKNLRIESFQLNQYLWLEELRITQLTIGVINFL